MDRLGEHGVRRQEEHPRHLVGDHRTLHAPPATIAPPSRRPAPVCSTTPHPECRSTASTRSSRPSHRGRRRKPEAWQARSSEPTKATTPPVPAATRSQRWPGREVEARLGTAQRAEREQARRPSRWCCRSGRPRSRRTADGRRARRWRPCQRRRARPAGRRSAAGRCSSSRCSAATGLGTPTVSARASSGAPRIPTSATTPRTSEGHAEHPAGHLLGPLVVAGVEQLDEGRARAPPTARRQRGARRARSTRELAAWNALPR